MKTIVCECEQPQLHMDEDRVVSCHRCGHAIVSNQAAQAVKVVELALRNGATVGADSMPASTATALPIPPELIEAIAERAAELVAERTAAGNDADAGWLRGAEAIAAYIGATPSRVYALSSAGRIPVEHDGSNLVAKRSVLDSWLENGGGKRP